MTLQQCNTPQCIKIKGAEEAETIKERIQSRTQAKKANNTSQEWFAK